MLAKLATLLGLLALASLAAASLSIEASLRPFSASLGSLLSRTAPASQVTWEEMFVDWQRRRSEIVVLDIRAPSVFTAGHVPGSFKARSDRLSYALPWFRAYKHLHPTLYFVGAADELDEVTKAAQEGVEDGWFSAVYFVAADFSGWPGKIETSELSTPITDEELKGKYLQTRILDVRPVDEFRRVRIPESVCVPPPSFNENALVWVRPLIFIAMTTEDAQAECLRAVDYGIAECLYFVGGFAAWTGDVV